MSCYNLMGIVIDQRRANAPRVQDVLTKYGCLIRTRLGIHETGNVCSEEGFIVLQLNGEEEEINKFNQDLNEITGVSSEFMQIKGK